MLFFNLFSLNDTQIVKDSIGILNQSITLFPSKRSHLAGDVIKLFRVKLLSLILVGVSFIPLIKDFLDLLGMLLLLELALGLLNPFLNADCLMPRSDQSCLNLRVLLPDVLQTCDLLILDLIEKLFEDVELLAKFDHDNECITHKRNEDTVVLSVERIT